MSMDVRCLVHVLVMVIYARFKVRQVCNVYGAIAYVMGLRLLPLTLCMRLYLSAVMIRFLYDVYISVALFIRLLL